MRIGLSLPVLTGEGGVAGIDVYALSVEKVFIDSISGG